MPREKGRHGVAHLVELAGFPARELKSVRKALQPSRLVDKDPPPSPVGQANSMHVPGCAGKVAASQCTRGLIGVKITRADTKRGALIFSYVFVYAWRQKLGFRRRLGHKPAQGFASRYLRGAFNGELKFTSVANNNHPLSVLRNSEVYGIEEAHLDNIIECAQRAVDFIEIPPTPVEHPANILEHPDVGLDALYSGDEDRKPVTRILEPQLVTAHAERLARRSADYDLCLRIYGVDCESDLLAVAFEVSVIRIAGVAILLIPQRLESLRLESKCKSATTCE